MSSHNRDTTRTPNLQKRTDREIDNWIARHEEKGRTGDPLYLSLIEERNRRHGNGLTLKYSIPFLIGSARESRFVSYGDLADANSVAWNKARHKMNGTHGHLQDILCYCHARSWPLLTAIVVHKRHRETGEMDDFTLDGFVDGAQRLGYVALDRRQFLREHQKSCFSWAKSIQANSEEAEAFPSP